MCLEFLDILNEITYNSGNLLKVNYVLFDNEYSQKIDAVIFYFEHRTLTVEVCDEEDTVILKNHEIQFHDSQVVIDSSEQYPWSNARGKHIRWGWLLTNQQGYLDALQIEFVNHESDQDNKEITIQLVAMANCLYIYTVTKCPD